MHVILPVYNAYEETERCVRSLQANLPEWAKVVWIDDASPDPRIRRLGERLSRAGDARWTILRNRENLGFVRTVNRGFALASGDCVVLNSDTVVTHGWLERLRRCAAADSSIGTATPWSNNAEICSFPELCGQAPMPQDPELLALAAASAGPPEYPELPTAVGFCMYVRRRMLDRIGVFDATTFGRGYGEENDLCMRARAHGWRHVLCDDCFVAHQGGGSFEALGIAPGGRAMERLLAKHPHYERLVHELIQRDPLAHRRAAIANALAQLEQAPERRM